MKLIRRKTEKFAEYMWKLLLINNIFCNPAVQRLRLHTFTAGGMGSIPDQRSHVLHSTEKTKNTKQTKKTFLKCPMDKNEITREIIWDK